MIINTEDPEAMWPKGEFVSLISESEAEGNSLVRLGNFCVQHGWNAVIDTETKKLWIIPRAAKASQL